MEIIFADKAIIVLRYIATYFILFFVLPRFLFTRRHKETLDNAVSNYVKMALFFVVLGYILAAAKLFELLAILFSLLIYFVYHLLRRGGHGELISDLQIGMYDIVDGKIKPYTALANIIKDKYDKLSGLGKYLRTLNGAFTALLFVAVLLFSAYLRFYDAWTTSAPGMSDAYVTLAWMKYINQRYIFHDGIYPQGFHIILAILHKFSALDPLYILKYTGPLNGVMITGTIGYFVYRVSGRTAPAVLASYVYGVMGGNFFQDWMRQASSNSQEFAFIFVFPALFFYSRSSIPPNQLSPFPSLYNQIQVCASIQQRMSPPKQE